MARILGVDSVDAVLSIARWTIVFSVHAQLSRGCCCRNEDVLTRDSHYCCALQNASMGSTVMSVTRAAEKLVLKVQSGDYADITFAEVSVDSRLCLVQ